MQIVPLKLHPEILMEISAMELWVTLVLNLSFVRRKYTRGKNSPEIGKEIIKDEGEKKKKLNVTWCQVPVCLRLIST